MLKITEIHKGNMPEKKLRVAAYCRVSTDKAEQQHSFIAQQMYFQNKFQCSETEELAEIYADTASGTSICRPGFQRLITDCRSGKIDRIIVKSLSRFARNTKECLSILRELKRIGVTVLFEKESIDTAKVSDEIMITVMEGLAQEESASISRNIRWSIKRKMASGTLGVARVPYGFKKVGGQLEIDEERADIISEVDITAEESRNRLIFQAEETEKRIRGVNEKLAGIESKRETILSAISGSMFEEMSEELKELNRQESECAEEFEKLRQSQNEKKRNLLREDAARKILKELKPIKEFDDDLLGKIISKIEAVRKTEIKVTLCGGYTVTKEIKKYKTV